MSRPIKFRVWSGHRKKYLRAEAGSLLYLGEERNVNEDGLYDFEPSGGILEQWTGLKDINGNDIYEGDIVLGSEARFETEHIKENIYMVDHEKPLPAPDIPFFRAFVEWNETCCCFGLWYLWKREDWGNSASTDLIDKVYLYNVIGNVNENPELLK